MRIIKRNGVEVDFDSSKIQLAIEKANQEVEETARLSERWIQAITEDIVEQCEEYPDTVTVEEVQDMVQNALIKHGAALVASKYITYRYTRALARKANTTDDEILSLIELANEEAKAENANKNPTIVSTQRDYMAGASSKDLTRRVLLPKDIVDAHDAGIIHFHDSDYFAQHMHNCFTAKTKFYANGKIHQFSDFNDGDIVVVKDKDGVLREATVHLYGKQKMQRVVFTDSQEAKLVTCTPNHRWILKDGSVTTNLKVGDILYTPVATEDPWIVAAILTDNKEMDAWCVEEPVTHSFMLDGDMVTGNCDLWNLEDMLQNGTVISETMIEKPHSFYTACNITTQLVAQISSSQYGMLIAV